MNDEVDRFLIRERKKKSLHRPCIHCVDRYRHARSLSKAQSASACDENLPIVLRLLCGLNADNQILLGLSIKNKPLTYVALN